MREQNWVEEVSESSRRIKQWFHPETGVEVFIEDELHVDWYGLYIQATHRGPLDRVSIGDPDTGLYKQFDNRDKAISFAEQWLHSDELMPILSGYDERGEDDDVDDDDDDEFGTLF